MAAMTCYKMLSHRETEKTEINSHLLKLCYLKVQGCAQIKGYSGEWEDKEKGKEERNKPSKLKTGYQPFVHIYLFSKW